MVVVVLLAVQGSPRREDRPGARLQGTGKAAYKLCLVTFHFQSNPKSRHRPSKGMLAMAGCR